MKNLLPIMNLVAVCIVLIQHRIDFCFRLSQVLKESRSEVFVALYATTKFYQFLSKLSGTSPIQACV